MTNYSVAGTAAFAGILAVSLASSSPAQALTSLRSPAASHTEKSVVVKVHGSWRDDDDEDHDEDYREYRHRHHRDAVVDAPFARVETGRRVVVDAPFAHVSVHRNGRHIVAPFVNIWIPRY